LKLSLDRKRIRATVRAVYLKASTSVGAFHASVEVPYIRLKAAVGRFVLSIQLSDNTLIASLASAVFGKVVADTTVVSEAARVVPNKRPSDTATAVDALDQFQVLKGVTDFAGTEDGDYFAEDYTFAGYTIVSFDIEVRKPVAEAVGITDLFDIVPNKQPSETVDLAETVVRGTISSIIDTPAVSSSGSLRMQDYCDFDYFAQDYVGTSLTF